MKATEELVNVNKDERPFMLTTKDNPFNPFVDYDSWYAFDSQKGYHSPEYQARIAYTSFDLTDEENEAIINQAIEDIIRLDPFDIYTKAYKP